MRKLSLPLVVLLSSDASSDGLTFIIELNTEGTNTLAVIGKSDGSGFPYLDYLLDILGCLFYLHKINELSIICFLRGDYERFSEICWCCCGDGSVAV